MFLLRSLFKNVNFIVCVFDYFSFVYFVIKLLCVICNKEYYILKRILGVFKGVYLGYKK